MRNEEVAARFKLVEAGQKLPNSGQPDEDGKAAEKGEMMWIRYCPHCKNKMCKNTLEYPIACEVCGWVWL